MHKAVEDIRDKIIRGELKEGQKLPPQDKFAKSLGISRGTLREALHQLMLMGLIEMRQGDGTYIRSFSPVFFVDSLSPTLLMDKTYTSELLDARLYIEGEVAFLAAKNATKEEIQELKNILNDMKGDLAVSNVEDFIKKDLEFHLLIAKCAKNRVLMKVVQTIRSILYQFIADFFTLMPQTIKNAVYYHNKILNAIERHDPIVSKKQMEAHIKSLIRRINKSRERQGTSVTNKEDERRSSST